MHTGQVQLLGQDGGHVAARDGRDGWLGWTVSLHYQFGRLAWLALQDSFPAFSARLARPDGFPAPTGPCATKNGAHNVFSETPCAEFLCKCFAKTLQQLATQEFFHVFACKAPAIVKALPQITAYRSTSLKAPHGKRRAENAAQRTNPERKFSARQPKNAAWEP